MWLAAVASGRPPWQVLNKGRLRTNDSFQTCLRAFLIVERTADPDCAKELILRNDRQATLDRELTKPIPRSELACISLQNRIVDDMRRCARDQGCFRFQHGCLRVDFALAIHSLEVNQFSERVEDDDRNPDSVLF